MNEKRNELYAKTQANLERLEGDLLAKRDKFNAAFDAESEALLGRVSENLEKLKEPFPEIELEMLTDPSVVDGEYLQAPGFDMRMKVYIIHDFTQFYRLAVTC